MTAILLGLNHGLARIDEEGHEGRLVLEDAQVWSLAVDRSCTGLVYAATWEDGLWRSQDEGRTWKRCAIDFQAHNLTRVAVGPGGEDGFGAVYVGTEPSALFRSTDQAESFEELTALQDIPSRDDWSFPPRPTTSHVWTIVIDPRDPDCLHVGIELGGIMSSFDGGATWRDRQPVADRDCHTLRMHSGAPGRIYEVGGAWYAQSEDQGAVWKRDLDGIPEDLRYFYSLGVDPADPDTFVMTASRDPFHGHYTVRPDQAWATAYRRSGGSEWQEIRDGFPSGDGNAMGWFATDEQTPGRIYYAAPRGAIYRTDDAGESWREVIWQRPQSLQSMVVRAAEVINAEGRS